MNIETSNLFAAPEPAATPPAPDPAPMPEPVSVVLVDAVDTGPAMPCRRRSLKAEVESMLRAAHIPYVAVDEAKKALFANAKLKSFAFVVYQQDGPNWLLECGERAKAMVADLMEWEKVFGDGFMGAFAVRRKDGIRFIGIDGKPLALKPKSRESAEVSR